MKPRRRIGVVPHRVADGQCQRSHDPHLQAEVVLHFFDIKRLLATISRNQFHGPIVTYECGARDRGTRRNAQAVCTWRQWLEGGDGNPIVAQPFCRLCAVEIERYPVTQDATMLTVTAGNFMTE